MIRILSLIFLLWCGAANAQLSGGLMFPGPGTAHSTGGGSSPAWTSTASPAIQSIGFASASATFSSVSIGTASSDRMVVVAIGQSTGNGGAITGVTLDSGGGAVAMTKVVEETAQTAAMYVLNVTSGTTATIVVTYPFNLDKIGIAVGKLTGVNTAVTPSGANIGTFPNGTNSNPVPVSATVPSTGIGIVGGLCYSGTNVTAASNVTMDSVVNNGSNFQVFIGHTAAGSGASITANINTAVAFTAIAMTMAAWGP